MVVHPEAWTPPLSEPPAIPEPASGARFSTLDGLRGFAALAMLLFHMEGFIAPGRVVGHGYLAVDLFFVISGVVIAHNYERRLQSGMGLGAFAARRLRRLWPMALLGLALSLVVLAAPALAVGPAAGPAELATWAVFGALFLPNPFVPTAATVLWVNGPAWSLHFELIANFLYGAQRGRWSGRFLTLLIGLAFLVLAVWAWKLGALSGGAQSGTYSLGLGRVLFSFPLGVLIYRLHRNGRLPRLDLSPWILVGAAFGLLCLPEFARHQGLSDLLIVGLAFPAIVALAMDAACGPRTRRLFGFVADISYPLYALHPPIVRILVVGCILLGAPATWWTALSFPVMGATIFVAYAAHRLIDARYGAARTQVAKPKGVCPIVSTDPAGLTSPKEA